MEIISWPKIEGSLSTSWSWIILGIVQTTLTLAINFNQKNKKQKKKHWRSSIQKGIYKEKQPNSKKKWVLFYKQPEEIQSYQFLGSLGE